MGRGGTIDEVWNLETMFSQLARRLTRMLVSGIFTQSRKVVVVPDVLCKFSKIGNMSTKLPKNYGAHMNLLFIITYEIPRLYLNEFNRKYPGRLQIRTLKICSRIRKL